TIGTQEWMTENLRAGGGFPQVSSSSDWSNLQQPAWSYYDNNPTNNNSFGKLYNGYAVNQYKNLCPTGWHIPNDFEWSILSKTLGGDNVSGGALKSINSTFWVNPNVGATNASCFSSIPNGYREADGIFKNKGSSAVYFQSDFSGLPLFRNLTTEETINFRFSPTFSNISKVGAAVRCLKGDSVGIYSPLVNLDSITQISPNSSRVYANVQDGGSQVIETGIVWSTVGFPSINVNKLSTSTAKLGNYDVNLTGLLPTTKYYVRAFAVNQIGVSYSSLDSFTTSKVCLTPTISDIDGNVYNTIAIGNQCWTKENLRVTKYNDGSSIPKGLNSTDWLNTTSGAYAIYDNDNSNDAIYGKLYNWYAVKDGRGLCPKGWHAPSDAEWITLTTYLGDMAGGKMKSIDTTLWNSPNTGATNESGFSALPGGGRNLGGSFESIRDFASFWSATEQDSGNAWYYYLYYSAGGVTRTYFNSTKSVGASVRCLRD
ncbi:MAG: fibrobacter succinogenes major paralogous domain-containing protein, partial [Haliscomenobacter sp.]|nr:fibrobacter succinogenes major paralogous domain-containing protein [Haliscomenobacter sp.]